MKNMYMIILFVIISLHGISSLACADEESILSKGQTLYVPAYSHIYAGNRQMEILLTVTLSLRNTDPLSSVTITLIDYYGTKGDFIQKFLDKPLVLRPLESTHYIIPHKDVSGGSGANFLVEWKSEKPVNPPLVESIMIGTQGISFTSRGVPIVTPH